MEVTSSDHLGRISDFCTDIGHRSSRGGLAPIRAERSRTGVAGALPTTAVRQYLVLSASVLMAETKLRHSGKPPHPG
jgi:hypothetical protein